MVVGKSVNQIVTRCTLTSLYHPLWNNVESNVHYLNVFVIADELIWESVGPVIRSVWNLGRQ